MYRAEPLNSTQHNPNWDLGNYHNMKLLLMASVPQIKGPGYCLTISLSSVELSTFYFTSFVGNSIPTMQREKVAQKGEGTRPRSLS